jgi:lipopolysaccharide biosynthesis protein
VDAEYGSRGLKRAFFTYDDLMDDWRGIISKLSAVLDLHWPNPSTAEIEIQGFLDHRHRHQNLDNESVFDHLDLPTWVKDVYATLYELKCTNITQAAAHQLESIRAELNRASDALGPILRSEELARQELAAVSSARIRELESKTQELQTQVNELEQAVLPPQAHELLQSGLFDANWYAQSNPDVALDGNNLIFHWLLRGWAEGRDPNPLFDTSWYLEQNPDVADAGINPAAHYLANGAAEGRDPNPLFDTDWYLEQNSDVAESGCNPLAHYLANGAAEGRDPNPLFDTSWYLQQNPDVAASQVNPLVHYLQSGIREGCNPNPLFDTNWYLESYPEVLTLGLNPLVHYRTHGVSEGYAPHPLFDPSLYLRQLNPGDARVDPLAHYLCRKDMRELDPHPLFDSSWYIENYPEITGSGMNPLVHYLEQGVEFGYDPSPLFDTSWYLEQNPDVRDSGANPLAHYVVSGAFEGRAPNPLFDGAWYLSQHPELAESRTNPLFHYMLNGGDGSINPGPQFDAKGYRARHKGLIETGMTPLEHFLRGLGSSGPGQSRMSGSLTSDAVYKQVYVRYSDSARREPSGEYYVPDSNPGLEEAELTVRLIAFYLPQFHPIAENDKWWGKGFTEWTNVSKAVPQFKGHYQPHLPGELGFYDLRLIQVQRRQAELARQYGIYGFCYYYYWFSGRRLLERPLVQMLEDSSLDFPFCICWANENWTRRWDGQGNEILLGQDHSQQSDIQFIEHAAYLFRDSRYIKINGRPLLIVYRVDLLRDATSTVERWRERCRELDVGEPYLVAAQTFGITDPRPYGFDAAVEFPPHNTPADDFTDTVTLLNPDFRGRIFSYRSVVDKALASRRNEPYPVFRCVFPGWDNEPRKVGKGHIFTGSTPRLYSEWIAEVGRETSARPDPEERIIFVNAWNEWAEGAHLEPDRRFGYAYLRATAETLRRVAAKHPFSNGLRIRWLWGEPTEPGARIAVIAHVFYLDLWDELSAYLSNIAEFFDLFVTVVREEDANLVRASLPENIKRCFAGVVPNRGRDMAPFLASLGILKHLGYEIALKVHTKGTSTRDDGGEWRNDMLEKVLGSKAACTEILSLMHSDREIGMIAPSGHLLPAESFWGRHGEAEFNLMHFERLVTEVGLPRRTRDFCFPAGSVYWFRTRALTPLSALRIDENDFPRESGQRDGTIAHALERIVGLASSSDGWRTEITKTAHPAEPSTAWLAQADQIVYPFACATCDGAPKPGPVDGIR